MVVNCLVDVSFCRLLSGSLLSDSKIFSKIAIQGKRLDGKCTKKPLPYRESFLHLYVTRPPDICVNFF